MTRLPKVLDFLKRLNHQRQVNAALSEAGKFGFKTPDQLTHAIHEMQEGRPDPDFLEAMVSANRKVRGASEAMIVGVMINVALLEAREAGFETVEHVRQALLDEYEGHPDPGFMEAMTKADSKIKGSSGVMISDVLSSQIRDSAHRG